MISEVDIRDWSVVFPEQKYHHSRHEDHVTMLTRASKQHSPSPKFEQGLVNKQCLYFPKSIFVAL